MARPSPIATQSAVYRDRVGPHGGAIEFSITETALCNTIGESRASRNTIWWFLARGICTLAYVPPPSPPAQK
jgi:hypothetical protein